MVQGAVAAAHFIRAIAPAYGIPVVLHSDHCHQADLPWLDGMLVADKKQKHETGEPLFSPHMIDLSALPDEENIGTTKEYLKRSKEAGTWLEMEVCFPLPPCNTQG